MGCDIHFFTEVKLDGKWHQYAAPNVSRWYGLFEKMAGVRGDVENAIVPPKGIPADASELVMKSYDYWDSDAHTPSWLNAAEINALEEWLYAYHKENRPEEYFYPEKIWGYVNGNGYGGYHKYPDQKNLFEDVRFVFWFDN